MSRNVTLLPGTLQWLPISKQKPSIQDPVRSALPVPSIVSHHSPFTHTLQPQFSPRRFSVIPVRCSLLPWILSQIAHWQTVLPPSVLCSDLTLALVSNLATSLMMQPAPSYLALLFWGGRGCYSSFYC